MEVASARWLEWRRDFPANGRELPAPGSDPRNLREQCLGIGVIWVSKKIFYGGNLDQSAEIHDSRSIRDVLNHAEVVANEQISQPQFLAQSHKQIENLGLNRNIQGSHRLVTDEELRVDGECSGNTDALTLSPGELVGIAALPRRIQPNTRHLFVDIGIQLATGHDAVHVGSFAQ